TDSAAMLFGTFRALMPVFAERLGVGTEGLGLLLAAPGVGSLTGAAFVMSVGDFRYKGLVIGASILAYAGAVAAVALSPWFLVTLLAAGATGFFDSWQATPRNGVIQLITPDALRGRVSAFQQMLSGGMPALGQALMGASAAALGAPFAMVAGAIACAIVVCGIFAARPDLRVENL